MRNNAFVEAYSLTTGVKQTIPRAWLEPGFPPGRDFRKTPLQVVADTRDDRPVEDWTKTRLTDFAAAQGIDLGDATTKADIWPVIAGVLKVGDTEMAEIATPRPATGGTAPFWVNVSAELEEATAQLAAVTRRNTELEALVAELEDITAPTDSDTTSESNTAEHNPTSTTENPVTGEKEH